MTINNIIVISKTETKSILFYDQFYFMTNSKNVFKNL